MLPTEKWEESRHEAKDLAQDYLDREKTRASCIKYLLISFILLNYRNVNSSYHIFPIYILHYSLPLSNIP